MFPLDDERKKKLKEVLEGKEKARIAQLSCPLLEELIVTGVPPSAIQHQVLHDIEYYNMLKSRRNYSWLCPESMDGWMDQWIDGWIDGLIKWSMNRWINGLMDRSIDGLTNGLIDRSMSWSMDWWFDGSIDWRPCRRQRELEIVCVWDREWGTLFEITRCAIDLVDGAQNLKRWKFSTAHLLRRWRGGRWSEHCQLGRCTNKR